MWLVWKCLYRQIRHKMFMEMATQSMAVLPMYLFLHKIQAVQHLITHVSFDIVAPALFHIQKAKKNLIHALFCVLC